MPIFATFVLGKKEGYFFNTPTHWAWHNLPPDVEALFTKTPAIKDVIEFALGNNGTYFCSYRDHDDQILCKHYNLPNALTSWLYGSNPSVVRDLPTLSLTLGPYDSYYAWDKSSASWSNLPPKLEKSVLSRLESQDAWKTTWKANGAEAPSFVSLGADEAYWMRTVSGGGCWDLKCSAPPSFNTVDGMAGLRGTNKFLEDSTNFSGIAGLTLFPSNPDAYILITTAGKSFSNLPEFTWADYNKISPALPKFTQSMQPIPPIPQPHQQQQPTQAQPQPQPMIQQPQIQYQQPYQQPQQQYSNCCPTNTGLPHNCCPQPSMQSSVQPRPYAAPPAFGYGAPMPQYGAPMSAQYGYANMPPGQQTGFTNGGYASGPVYR